MDNPSQAKEKPVVYVLHGDDQLAIRRFLENMLEKVATDPTIADMNTTRLDGRQASEEELRSSVGTMPFLADRRLVILTHPLVKANTDAGRKRFQALLDSLPDTAALVLVFEDESDSRGRWKSLHEHHWLHKWLEKAGSKGYYHRCALPDLNHMPEWVRKEAQSQGGQFTPEGARALAGHVGNDTQLAWQEIDKLLMYVDRKRPIEPEDVDELTAQGGEANVFQMVEEMASGNARSALKLLHRLLEEQEPLQLFGMVVRQFRLLIQVRELLDEGLGQSVAQEMHLYPRMANDLTTQARRFSMPQLEQIYHHLLDIDEAIKSSRVSADLALDTFFVELSK